MSIEEIITVDKEILSGTPVFKGTRVPIKNLLDYLEYGDDVAEFLDHFPSVKKEQALRFLQMSAREYLANRYHESFA